MKMLARKVSAELGSKISRCKGNRKKFMDILVENVYKKEDADIISKVLDLDPAEHLQFSYLPHLNFLHKMHFKRALLLGVNSAAFIMASKFYAHGQTKELFTELSFVVAAFGFLEAITLTAIMRNIQDIKKMLKNRDIFRSNFYHF